MNTQTKTFRIFLTTTVVVMMTFLGFSEVNAQSYPEMIFIKGGSLKIGTEDARGESALPLQTVKVNDFSIGKYPITVKEY